MKMFKFAQALVIGAMFTIGCQDATDTTAPDATPPATQEDVQTDDTLDTDADADADAAADAEETPAE